MAEQPVANTPATSTATPDLGATLAQPGPAAAPTMGSAGPVGANNATAANAPAQPSTVVPAGAPAAQPAQPPKHAHLLAMVQGLADGLSAASASIATHGREGGAEAVQQLQAQRQQMKQSADTAAQAKAAAALDMQIKTSDLTHMNATNKIVLDTLSDLVAQSHMKTAADTLETQQKAQEVFDTTGRIPTGWSADENTGQLTLGAQPKAAAGAAPAGAAPAGASAPSSLYNRRAGFILNAMGQELAGPNRTEDPLVTSARQVLTDPNSTIEQKQQALVGLQQKAGMNAQVMKNLTEKADLAAKQQGVEAGGVVGKLSTPEALAAPGAQAAIQARIDDPNTTPADVTRLRTLLPQAAVAQLNAENIKAREARNQQIVNQGDPDEAGRLLANRSLTLGELKSRQVTPKFIADSITAAQKYDPTYKAAEAEAQGKIAASPANSQFFGNTDSLLVRGGTLDQLDKAYAALGNTQIPVINKLDNLRKAAVGSGPLAAAYAAQLGVADDYSKVMSGGTGSDTSRQQALDIMSVNLSPEARPAAIKQIRQAVTSQRNGRVGTNPYMRDMYPDPSTRQETPGQSGTQAATPRTPPAGVPAGSKLMQAPGGTPHWMSPDKIAAAQQLGATEVQ